MRTLLAVLTALVPLLLGMGSARAQVGVPEVEKYFNNIRTLQARFVQNNPNGSIVQGTLYIRRPGRMRFEYDAPIASRASRYQPARSIDVSMEPTWSRYRR